MKRVVITGALAVVFAILLGAPGRPAHAGTFDAAQQQVDRIDKLLVEAEAKLERAGPGAVGGIIHDMQNAFSRGVRAYNATPRDERAAAEGQRVSAALNAAAKRVNEFAARVDTLEKAAAKNKKLCWDFKRATQKLGLSMVENLARLAAEPGSARVFGTNKEADVLAKIEKYHRVGEGMLALCADEQYAAIVASAGTCRQMTPVAWCAAAPRWNQLLADELQHEFAQADERIAAHMMTPDKLVQKDGWIAEDRVVQWDSYFTAQRDRADALDKFYAALGARPRAGDRDVGAAKQAARDALKQAAVDNAGKWKLPPAGPKHYGVKLAKATIKRWHKGAKVVKAFGSKPGGWVIHKNAIGVPLYRDRSGYILFKEKGAPVCQLRGFFVSEDFDGRRYAKAKAVHIASVRFQKCR